MPADQRVQRFTLLVDLALQVDVLDSVALELLGVGLLFAWTPLRRVRIGSLPPASGAAGRPFELRVPIRHEGGIGVLRDATLRVVVGAGTRVLGFVPMLRPGGLLVIDNVLWSGAVLDPETPDAKGIAAVNDKAQSDPRVENVLLPVRDGVMLVRKL